MVVECVGLDLGRQFVVCDKSSRTTLLHADILHFIALAVHWLTSQNLRPEAGV